LNADFYESKRPFESTPVCCVEMREGGLLPGSGPGLTGWTTLEAAITGQWDFKSGDLSATTGLPLEFFDYPGGDTDQQTVFGTTAAWVCPTSAVLRRMSWAFRSPCLTWAM
jgi:hypothetical protein